MGKKGKEWGRRRGNGKEREGMGNKGKEKREWGKMKRNWEKKRGMAVSGVTKGVHKSWQPVRMKASEALDWRWQGTGEGNEREEKERERCTRERETAVITTGELKTLKLSK